MGSERAELSHADDAVEAFYLGCWQRVGHYLWRPGMRRVSLSEKEPTPWGYGGLDCDAFSTTDWHVEKKDGWTAVGLEDRTVDGRPGSHSVFAFNADLSLHDAIGLAEDIFPEVVDRLHQAGRTVVQESQT